MSKLLPIWENLPAHFKQNLVDKLDFRSRQNLSACSKSERDLVDSCPISIHSLYIEQEDEEGFHLKISFSKNGTVLKFNCNNHDRGVSALYRLLSHRKTKTIFFDIYCEPEFSTTFDDFLSKFLEKRFAESSKLHVQHFSWNSGIPAEDTILRLLEQLNPNFLYWIRLNFVDIWSEEEKSDVVKKIVETEQWNRVGKIHLYDYKVDAYFKKFLHVNSLKICVEKLTEAMLLEVIEVIRTRDPPPGSQFVISASEEIKLDTLTSVFTDFHNVHRRLKEYQTPKIATLLTNESRCLVIIKWEKAIEATVCRREFLNEDFLKNHGVCVTLDMI
ncbi:hypothetical protein CRE_08740 [Caenorhabditis remanei]|uniref:Uncharacterized protein n=1 Tax=Caenorhabditis remanei TaxID=31234 RepID=E3LH98_CAERE|nr:hypothetical protein CRE_08740 [Caenorhabditis remanei]